MRCLKKLLLVFLTLVTLLGLPVAAEAKVKTTNAKSYSLRNVTKAEEVNGTWVKKSGGYKFRKENGKYVTSRWIKVEDKIFYINSKGYRTSGWIKYRNHMYYTSRKGPLWIGYQASPLDQPWRSKEKILSTQGWVHLQNATFSFIEPATPFTRLFLP